MYYYVNHTCRFARNTGIQRCVRIIARALIDTGIPLRPVVWDRIKNCLVSASPEHLEHLAQWSGPTPDAWAKGFHIGSEHQLDQWLLIVELVRGSSQPTILQLHSSARRYGLRIAWVFHDAIPVRLAHLYGDISSAASDSHRAYMRGLAESEYVFATSKTTALHLVEFLEEEGLPSSHVRVLPLALEFPGDLQPSKRLISYDLNRPLRLLSVGSLELRKNHISLLKAVVWLASHAAFPAELVLVGWAHDPVVVSQVKSTQKLNIPITWADDVDDQSLSKYYSSCDATVVASLEEGFGLTVAESLWYGKPCLMTTNGALGELVAGGGCYPFKGSNWQCLVEGLYLWLHKPDMRTRLASEAVHRPLRTWRSYANDLIGYLVTRQNTHVMR